MWVHLFLEVCSLLITTRLRRMGQGNVFSRVCHSVHGGGGCRGGVCGIESEDVCGEQRYVLDMVFVV